MKIPFAVNYGDEMKYTHHAPPSEIWAELQNDIDIGRLYTRIGGTEHTGIKGASHCSTLSDKHRGFLQLVRSYHAVFIASISFKIDLPDIAADINGINSQWAVIRNYEVRSKNVRRIKRLGSQ
jgi:hypothetical protein